MKNDDFHKYFQLYSQCIPVRGQKRSLILDLGKACYHFVPNTMIDILDQYKKCQVGDCVEAYEGLQKEIVIEYFEFLLEYDLLLLESTPEELEKFPPLSLTFETPYYIDNCIIDVNIPTISLQDYIQLIDQLSGLNCRFVQLRFFNSVNNENLKKLLNVFKGTQIHHVDLLLMYDETKQLSFFISLKEDNMRVQTITVHSVPANEENILADKSILLLHNEMTSEKCCGVVQPYYFSNNLNHYLESQKHNTCLNKKISIDKHGEIKNCPSMSVSYGNISNTTLRDALEKQGFKDKWFINKDQVKGCKNCEFRYVCSDCRAYIEDPNDLYSKPLKCGYNPETCEWEEWSTNPLKQKAMEYYGLKELVSIEK